MPVNPRKLGYCEPSAAALLGLAEADAAEALAAEALAAAALEETWLGYCDPRGLISNG